MAVEATPPNPSSAATIATTIRTIAYTEDFLAYWRVSSDCAESSPKSD